MQSLKINTEYEKWLRRARDPETGMPYGTHLIYKVCDGDDKRFEEGERLLRIAFEAGMAVPKCPCCHGNGIEMQVRQDNNIVEIPCSLCSAKPSDNGGEEIFDITDGKNRYNPCPGCGATLHMGMTSKAGKPLVICIQCDHEGPRHDTDKAAFDAWNKQSSVSDTGESHE